MSDSTTTGRDSDRTGTGRDTDRTGTVPVTSDSESELATLLSTSSKRVQGTDLRAVMTPGGIPERDPERADRGEFQSKLQYILTCIGYAVGLGNIWRFPSLAYENGGSAFLIPYVLCSLLFGLPILFMELVVGQFTQCGASMAYRHYFPLLQGLGWASAIMSIAIALFYVVIIAWTMIYMLATIIGGPDQWSSCTNEWNTKYCESDLEDARCAAQNLNETRFFNGSCTSTDLIEWNYENNFTAMGPAEEFFVLNVLKAENDFGNYAWEDYNYKMAIALFIAWSLCSLGLIKGVKWLGRLSLVTATVPYAIIGILFVRGVTLEGSYEGIRFYILEPKFEMLFKLKTWRAALTQACFSLSIGVGGMLSLASYNKRSHPCYRDALIIASADLFMSVFGGIAVFSTLGFIATKLNVPIEEVVQSGINLAFVAYPEAIARMPVPRLWAMLFFLMLFLLGLSTMFGYLEGFISSILDQFPSLRPRRTLVTVVVCLFGTAISTIYCFPSGIHWFQVLNDFIGSFALSIVIILEIFLINFCYGPRRYFRDVQLLFGRPRSLLGSIFGPSGWYIRGAQFITAPILATIVLIATFFRTKMSWGKGAREFFYPNWVEIIGYCIGMFPVLSIPAFMLINGIDFHRKGQPLSELITVQPEHPSIRYELPDPDRYDKWSHNRLQQKRSTRLFAK